MLLWIMPALAIGLVWDGTPGSTAYSDKPMEPIAWCLASLFAVAELVLCFDHWKRPSAISLPASYWWFRLFRDRIGPVAPSGLKWAQRAGWYSVTLAAIVTGRPVLALAWLAPHLLNRLRSHREDKLVRSELQRIERM